MSELAALGLLVIPSQPNPCLPTFDDFPALEMLSAAVKEALRLLPVSSPALQPAASVITCLFQLEPVLRSCHN